MPTFPTEVHQQEPTDIEPETIELHKRIREGNASTRDLQDRFDRAPKLEGFLHHDAFERRLGVLLSKGVKGVTSGGGPGLF